MIAVRNVGKDGDGHDFGGGGRQDTRRRGSVKRTDDVDFIVRIRKASREGEAARWINVGVESSPL